MNVLEKSIAGRGNGKCKGPEAGVDLMRGGPARRSLRLDGRGSTVVEGDEVAGIRWRVGAGCVGHWRPLYAWSLYSE